MILSYSAIKLCQPLRPLCERYVAHGMSGGLSSAGYDIALAEDHWIWPGRFLLASSIERFDMPADVIGVVHDKSTWARRGLSVQNTIIENGWEGYLTLELHMMGWRLLHLKRGMPIAQVLFHRVDNADRLYTGKYQHQAAGPQKARLEPV